MAPAITISSPDGETEAEFAPAANMIGCSLRHRGQELLDTGRGLEAYAERGKTMGIPLLYPWANRLARHGYSVAGREVSLEGADGSYGTDPNGLPIHGAIPGLLRWDVQPGAPPDRAVARLTWDGPELLELFPFRHEVQMDVRVAAGELTVETTVHSNAGDPVPVSFGFHPYLRIPGAPRSEWEVSLGARDRLVLNDRMLPTGGREPLAQREFRLGDASWDDGLAGLDAPPRFAVAGGGLRLAVVFDEGFPYAQVYAPPAHDYICFEPMTAPTNALGSGEDLTVLEPGASYATRWRIQIDT